MLTQIAKLSLLAASITTLIACGGGGGGGSTPTPPASKIDGRAIDGPLAGATVTFADCQDKTVLTDAVGKFTFPEGCLSSSLVVTGGVDTATDLPFTGTLKAPKNSGNAAVMITPITTLIEVLGADQAAKTATALGLNGVNLLSTDPTTHQALYAKTVAVQQLVEEINQAIAALGGNVSTDALNAAAFAAVAQALSSADGSTSALQDTAFITQVLASTLDTVKADLPLDIQNNLANVKANLAALTSATIAKRIQAIETTIISMTNFSANADNTAAIKAATKDTIIKAKEAVDTEKSIALLQSVLTADSTQIAALLAEISTHLNAATVDTAALTASLQSLAQAATAAGVTLVVDAALIDDLSKPNAFFTNYLKLSGFSIGNTVYNPAQLTSSLLTPITLTSLDNLFVSVDAAGNLANTTQAVAATLKVQSANPETVTVNIKNVALTFGTSGSLSAATIPSGATLSLSSASRNASFKTTAPINVYQNGSVALNLATLQQLLPSHLQAQLTDLMPKGTTTVTATIAAGSTPIAYEGTNGVTTAPKYTLGTNTGSGITAKFNLPQ